MKIKTPPPLQNKFPTGDKTFFMVTVLYFTFVVIEITAGLNVHSVALLATAALNLITFSILISEIFTFRLIKIKTGLNSKKEYKIINLFLIFINLVTLTAAAIIAFYQILNEQFILADSLPFALIITGVSGIVVIAITVYPLKNETQQDVHMHSEWATVKNNSIIFIGLICIGFIIYKMQWYNVDIAFGIITLIVIFFNIVSLFQKKLHLD